MPPDRYAAPLIARWDGPEDADLRRRIQRAVDTGVQRAIAAASQATPSHLGQPGEAFTAWGPDPEQGMWVLPSYGDADTPVAVPVQESAGSVQALPRGDPAAGTETYTFPELQRAIRAAFPSTGGAAGQGILHGIYGKISGTDRPMLYYVSPAGESETLNSLFLYYQKTGQGKRLPVRERAAALKLEAGFYTVTFQPHGRGMLIRNGEPLYRDMENPEDLDLTVAFVVDPLHVAHPQAPPWRFVPVTRIVAANVESPLATGAESLYSAYTDIWQVDEAGVPQSINEFAFFLMSAYYRWEIYKLPPGDTAEPAAELVHEADGYDQRAIRYTWEKPGSYQVKCIVSVHGTGVSDRPAIDWRKERVVERQLKMALQLELLERRQLEALEHPQDPPHEQIWAQSGIELLEKFEAELCDEKAEPSPNQPKIDYLEEVIGKLRDQLYPADRAPALAFPIHAVFMDRKMSQTRPVSLFLAFEHQVGRSATEEEMEGGLPEAYRWYLIDLTYPAFYRTYEGEGATALEALLATFRDSETSFRRTYPPGQILARVTVADMTSHGIEVPAGFKDRDFTFETDSWQKDAYEWATLGLQVVGAIGLVAAFVFPPSAALGTALVLTGVAGAALSVMNIADRVAHNSFYWDVETFTDIASIAAAIAQVGALAAGTRASALARVVASAEDLTPEIISSLSMATKVQRALLLTQLGTDVANGLILGYGTYEQLRLVEAEFDKQSLKDYQGVYGDEEGCRRWQQERENRITGIFAHAVVGGTLIVVSVRSDVMGLGELGKTTEVLRQLGDMPVHTGAPGEPAGAPGPPPRWKGLKELQRAAATDPEAGQDLAWYQNAADSQLLAREALGDPVATGLLNQRFGGAKRPYEPPRPLDPAIQQKLKTELQRYRAAIETKRQRLIEEQQRLESQGQLKPEERDQRLEEADPATWEIMKSKAGEQVVPPTGKELRRYRGTIAVGVSDITALQGEVFEGASPMAFGSYDPAHPIRPPESIIITKAHGHAEQSIGQQIHDRLAALSPEDRAAASGGTIWIHVDQEVCSACAAGLGESDRAGVVQRLSELNPDLLFVITADDTSKVIRLRAGEQVP